MALSKKILRIKKGMELFISSESGRWTVKIARWLFLAAILFWLGMSLREIGWQAVWQNLPVHPLFYFIFIVIYVSAPIADIIIYKYLWSFDLWSNLDAFIKKRILNTDVIGYSGEVYFFTWARNQVELPDLKIGETIRDVNILSALASNSKAIIFLLVFGYWAREQISVLIGSVNWMYFGIVTFGLLILIPLFVRFRRYIFVMPFKKARFVYGVYFGRLTITAILQIVMWIIVIPGVPLVTWIIYAVVAILLSRIPVSNKKLIFAGVGVEMSLSLGVPKETIFGLLICVAALEKILNFVLYLSFTVATKFNNEKDVLASEPAVTKNAELESKN